MRKAPALLAALVAAVVSLAVPEASEAKASKQGKNGKKTSIQSHRPGKASVRKRRAPRPKARRRATRQIKQNERGKVVMERIRRARPELYGPFLPLEAHVFPQPPCPEVDVILTAEIHEVDAETPDRPDAEQVALVRPGPGLVAQLTNRLGSLLRPKSSASRVRPQDVDLSDLLSAGFLIPVEGVDAAKLRDSFLESRGRHAKHLAIDIGAPRGTPVLATADGEILRLARERRGGISIYQKDDSGQHLFFYCHLSRYADGLAVGQKVSKGDVIGFVGSTGRVRGGPHLHFSMTRLCEQDGDFKEGLAINPYLLFLAGVP